MQYSLRNFPDSHVNLKLRLNSHVLGECFCNNGQAGGEGVGRGGRCVQKIMMGSREKPQLT